MRNYFIFVVILTTFLGGCYPESLKYKIGIKTSLIEGTFLGKDGNLIKSDCFIVVVEHYSRFVRFENESPIYVPKARLVFPNKKGFYRIIFDIKATSIDLAFIASGYKMQRLFFRRQLGVGDLQYNVRLLQSESWRNELFFQTGPFLENFILEQRYKMPDFQQMYIGNWIAEEKKKNIRGKK